MKKRKLSTDSGANHKIYEAEAKKFMTEDGNVLSGMSRLFEDEPKTKVSQTIAPNNQFAIATGKKKVKMPKRVTKPCSLQSTASQTSKFHSNVEKFVNEHFLTETEETDLLDNADFVMECLKRSNDFLVEDICSPIVVYEKQRVLVPFKCVQRELPAHCRTNLQFSAPSHVLPLVSGIYPRHSAILDLAVCMPKSCVNEKEYKNEQYHLRRAVYLSCCAALLLHNLNLHTKQLHFEQFCNDPRSPALILKLKIAVCPISQFHLHLCELAIVDCDRTYTYRLLPCPESSDLFPVQRFLPTSSNLRTQWVYGSGPEELPVTAHYNQSIVRDLLLCATSSKLHTQLLIQHSYKIKLLLQLLCAWLDATNQSQGFGAFSHFHMRVFVLWCLREAKLKPALMTVRVLFLTVLHAIENADWSGTSSAVIGLDTEYVPANKDVPRTTIAMHARMADVLMLDFTAYMNIASMIGITTINTLKHHASLAQSMLKTEALSHFNFHNLFVRQQTFELQFDQICSVLLDMCWQEMLECAHADRLVVLDQRSHVPLAMTKLLHVLQQALTDRVRLIHATCMQQTMRAVTEESNLPECVPVIRIGLLLAKPELAFAPLTRGPAANAPQAKHFRTFWCNKSELRKFGDGHVCEAVLWKVEGQSAARMLPLRIIRYILRAHFARCMNDPGTVQLFGGQLEAAVCRRLKGHVTDTGEAQYTQMDNALSKLQSMLRGLQDMPLAVNRVQPVGPLYTHTEPLCPSAYDASQETALVVHKQIVIEKGCVVATPSPVLVPQHTPALTVHVGFEHSNKWPDKLAAVCRIKAALHIRLAQALRTQYKVLAAAAVHDLLVLVDGYAFRLLISDEREVHLQAVHDAGGSDTRAHKGGTNNNAPVKHSVKAALLHRTLVHAPKLASVIHGVSLTHNLFSLTCRLAKRWLHSHMFSDCISDELVELLVCGVFVESVPLTAPASSVCALLRWLTLLAHHPWMSKPLIVNFNQQFTDEQCVQINSQFRIHRATLPPICVPTPIDLSGTMFSRPQPSAVMLEHIVGVARKCAQTITQHLQSHKHKHEHKYELLNSVFSADLHMFDVLVYLKESAVARKHESLQSILNEKVSTITDHKQGGEGTRPARALPVVDYDPVQFLLQQLNTAYSQQAVFLCDRLGGSVIGVLWRPNALLSGISHNRLAGRKPMGDSLVTDQRMILQDITRIGHGIVRDIHIQRPLK